MNLFFKIVLGSLISLATFAQKEINYEIQNVKCSGSIQKDGSIVYQGNCPKTVSKNVKKKDLKQGEASNSINNQAVDTPAKAMELYNKAKNAGATSISIESGNEQETLKKQFRELANFAGTS